MAYNFTTWFCRWSSGGHRLVIVWSSHQMVIWRSSMVRIGHRFREHHMVIRSHRMITIFASGGHLNIHEMVTIDHRVSIQRWSSCRGVNCWHCAEHKCPEAKLELFKVLSTCTYSGRWPHLHEDLVKCSKSTWKKEVYLNRYTHTAPID